MSVCTVTKVNKKTRKGGTESSRRHAFQSFTQKVAAIKIDPIRRVRRHIDDEEITSEQSSFFHESLNSWIDLNLATTFTDFAREIIPWSESLPHVLHHQDKIMDALVKAIEGGDEVGLEPLLSLLSQFARDLGVQFERHFQRAVETLSKLIVRHKSVEVTEWAFNSLAYLLKYLSRLLVPDLRPLYDILAPLLGKTPQKTHITRFAAEVLSFLLRKAKGDALKLTVNHVAIDLVQSTKSSNPARYTAKQYPTGLMIMFTDACMGVDYNLHSRADAIVGALLQEVVDIEVGKEGTENWEHIVLGILTSLIHKTQKETFQPALDTIVRFADGQISNPTSTHRGFVAKLLFTCLATRKGNRVNTWETLLDLTLRLLEATIPDSNDFWLSCRVAAVALQSANLEVIISRFSHIVEVVRDQEDGTYFIAFCDFFAKQGDERFKQFLLPYVQRFIVSQWSSNEDRLCTLIPRLSELDCLTTQINWQSRTILALPAEWQKRMIMSFEELKRLFGTTTSSCDMEVEVDESSVFLLCKRYLSVLDIIPLSHESSAELLQAMKDLLHNMLSQVEHTSTASSVFLSLLGRILMFLVKNQVKLDGTEMQKIWRHFGVFGGHPLLLGAFAKLLSKITELPVYLDNDSIEIVLNKLQINLTSSNHGLRNSTLSVLSSLFRLKFNTESDILVLMSLVEDTQVTLASSRTVSMHVRKLGILYSAGNCHPWAARVLPYYCFGLLSIKFASLWDDAIATLSQIAQKKDDVVANLAFSWLEFQVETTNSFETEETISEERSKILTAFECSNTRQLEDWADICIKGALNPTETGVKDEVYHLPPDVSRTQALKVLYEIPAIAEKRSRLLVPMLLEWTRKDQDEDIEDDDDEDEEESAPTTAKWSHKDRIAMLTLFSKFHNPKKLYKSEAVYDTFLKLLASGDQKTQTLALKCILTWKLPGQKTYEDNLTNLLDDTRFRDEITNFIQVDQDESVIQEDHRQELMPVLLRILYGRSLSRKNASSGKKGMESRRTVVLASLANFKAENLETFLQITLGHLAEVDFVDKINEDRYAFNNKMLDSAELSTRKRLGFVHMVEDMLKQLGKDLKTIVERLVDALLYCVVGATNTINEMDDKHPDHGALKVSRTLRQIGFRCLNDLFRIFPEFKWQPYMPSFFEELITPRLASFATETSQSKSGLLQIFSTWASSSYTAPFLVDYHKNVLVSVASIMGVPSVKDEVVLYIFEMLEKLIRRAEEDDSGATKTNLITPYEDVFLVQTSAILQKSPGKDVLEKGIEVISHLSPHISGAVETRHLVEISVFLLSQPSKRVNPKMKSGVLKILLHFLPLCTMDISDPLFKSSFRTTSSLYGFFRDRASRELLAQVTKVIAERDPELKEVALLSAELNSYSKKTLGEPDFDRRLKAYSLINEDKHATFTAHQWIPIINNMLFFIKDNEELPIRTSASYTLRRFAEACGRKANDSSPDQAAYFEVLASIVMPALQNGFREPSEMVRLEYVSVLAHIVKECASWPEVSDMKELLVGGDEEANFFFNILHIQQHRRARAIRRLGDTAKNYTIKSSNVAHFMIPLIEHFVFDQGEDAHNLATDGINTIGVLAEQLEWAQYRAVFKRYVGYIKARPELERIVVRIIGSIVDSLARAAARAKVNEPIVEVTADSSVVVEVEDFPKDNVVKNGETSKDAEGDISMEPESLSHLSTVLPPMTKLAGDISNGLLPTLINYLHQKDEFTTGLRIPVAVPIVKLLRVLPDDLLAHKLPAVLTDVCHILKSRDQNSRDMTRKTLAEISAVLGPSFFGFIVKELRSALLRGYQLHVLSYTVHSLLVSIMPTLKPGDLDYCVSNIVNVVMDDIFGVTASEKEAEGYTNKMKEIKSNKSYDSMELLASISTLSHLGDLIRPLRDILHERLNLSLIKKIDELFRRLGVGLLKNDAVKSHELMVFCYEAVQESYTNGEPRKEKYVRPVDPKREKFLINMKVPGKRQTALEANSHSFKLTKFALDILRVVLQKHDFLMTPVNLEGFVPIVGDAILAKEEEVQISALRLLTTIIRVPMKSLDDGAAVFVAQSLTFIKSCPSTNAELAQASLKFLAAILREHKTVQIKDLTLAYVLNRVKPDLEEPDRQGVTFNFLKAVLSRKIQLPEVYDVIDDVAVVMVTNQTRHVRDLCRGLYFQFLMDYPQAESRLKKQLAFLIKNMDYEHQEGRKSVLEAINLLLTKVGDGNDLIQRCVSTFFVPLVMAMVNDESMECRDMSGALIKKCFERADKERLHIFLAQMRNWMSQTTPVLARLSFQLYTLYFEAYAIDGLKEVPFVAKHMLEILQAGDAANKHSEEAIEWEQLFYTMQTWTKIVQMMPEETKSGKYADMWAAVRGCLSFPNVSVRLFSARLLGLFFSEFKNDPSVLPLSNGKGLELDGDDMVGIARACSGQLNSAELTDELGLQVVRNLLFLGRCFYANGFEKQELNRKRGREELPHADEKSDSSDEEDEAPQPTSQPAVLWLIGRISGVIRNEKVANKKNILGKKYGMQWIGAMTQIISPEEMVPMATKMIMPLYNLMESTNENLQEMKTFAQEVLGLISTHMGTTEYSKAYAVVRSEVQDRRRVRKTKRSIQLVTNPEQAAKRKMRKHERGKESRKKRSRVFAETRRAKYM